MKKSISKKLNFANSEFLTFIKFDIFDFTKSGFLELAKVLNLVKFFIFLAFD